jgi:hypothetical protein
MFIIIYKKSTKHIVQVRSDASTNPVPAETWLNIYIKDHKLTADQGADLTYVETSPIEFSFVIGKHMWNESTQQVDEDPNYVPPTPITPVEPTA